MNRLQTIQFEMLKEFVRICEKLNLQYYLICGTALGSAKYNGVIPWDDDIDVALPRKDYDIFVEKAQEMLPAYYFLQNCKTDKHFHHFCSKIRDSRTTYVESDQKELNIHHGVFIDVIPLDLLPDDSRFSAKYRIFRICQLIYLRSPERYKNRIKSVLKPFVNIRKVYARFEKYLKKRKPTQSPQYCNFHSAKNNRLYMDAAIYGKGRAAVYEGMAVVIPERYDECLTAYYGDWRAELPEEQQVGHHGYEILDLDRPYTDYIAQTTRRGKRILLKKESQKENNK